MPHSESEGSTTSKVDGTVSGMAATIGRVSDSSMIDSSDSPISLDTGNVDREAGSRMMGCGKARTESFEVAITENGSNDRDSATAGPKIQAYIQGGFGCIGMRRDFIHVIPPSLPFNRTGLSNLLMAGSKAVRVYLLL